MTMARLYADEDFPGPVVECLRLLGHDVLTVQEAGRDGRSDSDVLTDASADQRIVLTHNHRDFRRLHRMQPHTGIISCTRDKDDMPGLARRIHDALGSIEIWNDALVRVIRPNPSAKS